MLKDEEDRIISRSKELLGRDRLDALEGRGRSSRIQEEVRATDNALKALQTTLSVPPDSKWQMRSAQLSDKTSISLPPEVQTPRSVKRERDTSGQGSVNQASSAEAVHSNDKLSESAPQSYLSKEAQLRLAQICVVHGAGLENEKPISVAADDESESVIIWAARCNTSSIDVDKTPFRELVSVPESERRSLAPHISTIYDQIFLNSDTELGNATHHGSGIVGNSNVNTASGGQQSMFMGLDNRKSTQNPPVWRTDEGFWVDFKSVDLGQTHFRGSASRENLRTYGSVTAVRPEEPSFFVRSLEQVKVAVLALAVVVCCFFLWRCLVGLSDADGSSFHNPLTPNRR